MPVPDSSPCLSVRDSHFASPFQGTTAMARQPCDVFISYSAESGADAASKLERRINEVGLTPFAYEYTLTAGQTWQQKVLDALRTCRCVFVLVPSDDKAMTDYMNHEIGIAHLLDKQIVPVALDGEFRSAAPMSELVSQYWGRSLAEILSNIERVFHDLGVYSGARRTSLWSHYLVSDSIRLVQGRIDPRKLKTRSKGSRGTMSVSGARALSRACCVYSPKSSPWTLRRSICLPKTSQTPKSHAMISSYSGGPIRCTSLLLPVTTSVLEYYLMRLSERTVLAKANTSLGAIRSETDSPNRDACWHFCKIR